MAKKTLHLIDKEGFKENISYQANIGGQERLLSEREVVALIDDALVWEEKEVTVY